MVGDFFISPVTCEAIPYDPSLIYTWNALDDGDDEMSVMDGFVSHPMMGVGEDFRVERTMVFGDDNEDVDDNDNNINVKQARVYACFCAFVFDGIAITPFDAL